MIELIKESIYYKIFDKTYKNSSHIYIEKVNYPNVPLSEIEANKRLVIDHFGAKDILVLKQVHGNRVIDADSEDITGILEADGSVTSQKNLILAIQTADCVPVLFASNNGTVIGAAHCGFRSSQKNIIHNIVEKMQQKGVIDITAVIGPAIAQSSYEKEAEFYNNFLADDKENAKFFVKSKRQLHYMFDLSAYVESKLRKSGIKNIRNISEDTYINEEKYPSYRRSVHRSEHYKENILSTIVIK